MFYQDNPRPDECLCPHVLKHTVIGFGLAGKGRVPPLSWGFPRGILGFEEPRHPWGSSWVGRGLVWTLEQPFWQGPKLKMWMSQLVSQRARFYIAVLFLLSSRSFKILIKHSSLYCLCCVVLREKSYIHGLGWILKELSIRPSKLGWHGDSR